MENPQSMEEIALAELSTHGGHLASARLAFPDAPEPWLDLSTGISPFAYPVTGVAADTWTRLPDSDRLERLKRAARAAYGLRAGDALVAAPGTQAILQLLPFVRPAQRVAVLGPTYAEHGRCWSRAGAEVTEIAALGQMGEAEVVVVVNPNNPDGRVIPSAALRDAAGKLADRGGLLVVDEAFADFEPGTSLPPHGLPAAVLVLKSFGKAYGLAGIRLGFAMGERQVVEGLAALFGPWAVPGPALDIGARAFTDHGWRLNAMGRLDGQSHKLDDLLAFHGFAPAGGTRLFRLVRHDDAGARFRRLAQAGVLVRAFSFDRTILRFGIPADDAALARIDRALAG